jgi:hypothetical protein
MTVEEVKLFAMSASVTHFPGVERRADCEILDQRREAGGRVVQSPR